MKKSIQKIIILNKKEGETPLEALTLFRVKHSQYKNVPMTYAGRLDPMASGVLVLLAGEETKNKEKYLALSKEYDFEILFGFATDTYDILGKIVKCTRQDLVHKDLEKKILENLQYFTGKFIQKYPLYSSKTVKGKPLFIYARNNEDVEVPTREVNVKELKLLKIRKMSRKKLLENIEKRIKKVKGPARPHEGLGAGGDFRQKEIIKIWRKNLSHKQGQSLLKIASFKIKCSSGTYVRGIANSLGERVGVPALAFTIKRTKVGKYKLGK